MILSALMPVFGRSIHAELVTRRGPRKEALQVGGMAISANHFFKQKSNDDVETALSN